MPSSAQAREDYGVLSQTASQPDTEICGAVSESERVIGNGIPIGPDGNAVSTSHRVDTHDVGIRGHYDAARGCIEVNRNRLSPHDRGMTCDGQGGQKVGCRASHKGPVANTADLRERDEGHDRYHRQYHTHFYERRASAHCHSPCWMCGLYTAWGEGCTNQIIAPWCNASRIRFLGSRRGKQPSEEVMRVTKRSAITSAFLVAVSGACTGAPSGSNEAIGATVLEMSEAITSLQQSQAELQEQIDSLRSDIARQDTLVRQIANLAGMPR